MKRTSSSSSAWPLRRLLLLPVVVAALVSSGRADPNAAAVEGFKFEVVSGGDCGDGERRVKKGDVVEVHYTGRLTDENGAKFDSSRDRGGEPIKYQTGANQVIRGWELGVEGMCVGEKRRLTIPPELGYGDRGAGEAVPPGATLFFEIELVSVADGGSVENVFKLMDADGDNVLTREELTEYIDREVRPSSSFSSRTTVPDLF